MPEKHGCEQCSCHKKKPQSEYWHYFKITLPANIFWLIVYVIAFLIGVPYLSNILRSLGLN